MPSTVVCIHIQCTQDDDPMQRRILAGWLRSQLEMMNRDGTLIESGGVLAENVYANTAIAITIEERGL
jgi:hypothetical protein